MAVQYKIRVSKDGANVMAEFDVRVTDMLSPELLSDFRLSVEGVNLVPDFLPGQKAFVGSRAHVLENPKQDAPVTFNVSTNVPWSADLADTLRGEKYRDDVDFDIR